MSAFADVSPKPVRRVDLSCDVGRIVGDHRLVINALCWFPDLATDGDFTIAEYLDLTYSFEPPLTEEERVSPGFAWKVWELQVQDDVGTNYDATKGGLGSKGGDREILPAPPEAAQTLSLLVGTPQISPDGTRLGSTLVAQIDLDLRSGVPTVVRPHGSL